MTMKSSIETITSLQNPKVKEVTALQSSSSLRREKGLFVVEGRREVERCVESGFRLRSVFYCPALCRHFPIPSEEVRIFEVSEAVYGKIAYRGSTEGLLAVVCGPLQSQPDPRQSRRSIYPQYRRMYFGRSHCLAQGTGHQHPYRPAAGLGTVLRHRHDPPDSPGLRH